MAWYDSKSPAVDPDNPTADEQVTAAEWNAMGLELRNRLIGKDVDDTNLADNRILVYDLTSDTFVFEDQGAISELNDIPNVIISGVPADNEVFAYDDAASKWINQTATEAGLATVVQLAAYLPLAGGTMSGSINLGGNDMRDIVGLEAYTGVGIRCKDNLAATKITLATTTYAFTAGADATMQNHKILSVTDPTSAQDAATKNYADTHLFSKEVVTDFTDGYTPIYNATSGKFEMEAGGGSAGLPVVDTTSIVKGSADGTKLMRLEVDGLTTGMTRVMTVPDKDMTLCGIDDAMILSGANTMSGDMNLGGNWLTGVTGIRAYATSGIYLEEHDGDPSITLAERYHSFKCDKKASMEGNDLLEIGALVLNDATELTIADGLVTATQSYHTIDTQADAATDNLDTISGGTAGMKLTIRAIDSARTVVVRDGAENINIEGDMTLDNAKDTLSLLYDGSEWIETGRANNGA